MSCDSYYEKGSTHLVCQDYALSGSFKGIEYGIVADGCSSADHSEVGAQILCHVAKYNIEFCIQTGLFERLNLKELSFYLGNGIHKRADEIRKIYPITPKALEATLLITIRLSSRVLVFAWGDGVITANYRKEDGGNYQLIMKIDYSLNAPFYLISDRTVYLKNCAIKGEDNPQCFREIITLSGEKGLENPLESSLPFDTIYSEEISNIMKDKLLSVTICTDGISTYRDSYKKDIGLDITIPEFIGFKNTTGEFVKKRMIFFGKKVKKHNWHHYDDVGTATIYLNEEY